MSIRSDRVKMQPTCTNDAALILNHLNLQMEGTEDTRIAALNDSETFQHSGDVIAMFKER